MRDSMLNQNRQDEFQIMGLCNVCDCMFQISNESCSETNILNLLTFLIYHTVWLSKKFWYTKFHTKDKNVNCPHEVNITTSGQRGKHSHISHHVLNLGTMDTLHTLSPNLCYLFLNWLELRKNMYKDLLLVSKTIKC
jgi:hypothetical protein